MQCQKENQREDIPKDIAAMKFEVAMAELEGIVQPAPAPRFSRPNPEAKPPPAFVGEHTDEVLRSIGMQDSDIQELKSSGEIA